jgi:hypothetical protein
MEITTKTQAKNQQKHRWIIDFVEECILKQYINQKEEEVRVEFYVGKNDIEKENDIDAVLEQYSAKDWAVTAARTSANTYSAFLR